VRRYPTPAVVLIGLACQLWVTNPGLAQTPVPATHERLSVEDATRLTWRLETRAQGIAALQAIVSDGPEDANARFELGRVLTWNVQTRTDGVAHLRRVLEQAPQRNDAAETLADVLSWDPQTRAEAIQRLRALLEGEPMRTSARLKLAEVLSWTPATRDESHSLYLRVLRDDPQSVDAAVGLGRLLSWRGRARASLKMLSSSPAGALETPDAFRVRAQVYADIGRPARALEEYERLLAIDPANEAALQGSRLVRRGLRPSLEMATEASTESGDPASTKVESSSVPLRLVFHPTGGDLELSVTGAQAWHRNGAGSSRDRFAGAGLDTPVGNRVRLSGDLVSHEFDRAGRRLTGRSQFQIAVHDGYEVRLGASREQLFSSRLSLAGEQSGDTFYGPSFVNQVMAGGSARLGGGWDVWGQGTAGWIRGENVANNSRQELLAVAGRSFHAGVVTLRPGYSLNWMSYRLDLGGFPSINPGDGVNAPGIGGYFSPLRFLNQMARLDATVPLGGSLSIFGGAGVGRQQLEDSSTRDFSHRTGSSEGYLGIRLRAGERVSIRTQANYQDVASAFNHVVVQLSVSYGF
jgi:tetratricopeptide (TPR) repeat protein